MAVATVSKGFLKRQAVRQHPLIERQRQRTCAPCIEAAVPTFAEFLCNHVWIRDKGGSKFEPWPWQQELAEVLPSLRRAQFLKARQLGMSWELAAYALHKGLTNPGHPVLLLSQTEPDAIELLDKVKFIYERLPDTLKVRIGRDNTRILEFADLHSAIRALPSTEKAGRGFTGSLVVADEHAFHQWAVANMAAVDPTIEAGGQFLSLSSANGIGNLFHDLWSKASQTRVPVLPYWDENEGFTFGGRLREAAASLPDSAWLAVFLPYNVRPGRDAAWWENKRANTTPQWLIFQEYPREPDEAFVQTGRPVFAKDHLDRVKVNCRAPLPKSKWPPALQALSEDELRIFTLPTPGHRYAAGADVAEGLEHGDYCDLSALDADTQGLPEEVLTLHGHWAPDEYAKWIDIIARIYPGIWGVERNNHGIATILKLQELGTPGLFREKPIQSKPGERPEPGKVGWTTSSVSKPLMIDGLEEALRCNHLILRDELAFPELTFYQTKKDGSTGAPSGQWDDRVISRAIAVQMLRHLPAKWGDEKSDFDGPSTAFSASRWNQ